MSRTAIDVCPPNDQAKQQRDTAMNPLKFTEKDESTASSKREATGTQNKHHKYPQE